MRFLFLLISLTVFSAAPLGAALAAPVPPVEPATITAADLSRDAVEARIGRKLKFSERIALSVVRGKVKRQARKRAKAGPDGTVVDAPSLLSMILGILAFAVAIFTPFAFFLAIAALVLGIVGLGRVKRAEGYRTGKGFAVAGIVLGGIWLVLLLLLIVLLLIFFR